MGFVADNLPTPTEIVGLPPDEVGLRLLALVGQGQGHLLDENFYRQQGGLVQEWGDEGADSDFHDAMIEAFQWLQSERLIVKSRSTNYEQGQHQITRRGHHVLAASNGRALIQAEDRIGLELHESISSRVRRQFLMGEYEQAALIAMKQVEMRVRELAQAPDDSVGVALVRNAFALPRDSRPAGPLTDTLNLPTAEQEATMHLFAGAIGVFKNPSSHREVEYDDPTFASEVVLFADLLLRMLDRIAAQMAWRRKLEGIVAGSRLLRPE